MMEVKATHHLEARQTFSLSLSDFSKFRAIFSPENYCESSALELLRELHMRASAFMRISERKVEKFFRFHVEN
jgi:hypothetical protein